VISSHKLDTGDYSVRGLEDYLCIERKKSVSELASNITEKRFTNELERMAEFPHKFLILEFDYRHIEDFPEGCHLPKKVKRKIKVTSNFIMRRLSEIQMTYDIHVIPCGNVNYAEQVAATIIKRINEKYL